MRKVFHARGVVFKGSGFYVTDSRQPNPANRRANGKDSSSKDETSDSKPKAQKSKVTSSENQKSSSQ